MIFEPILFGITGTEIKISEMNGEDVKVGLICLAVAIIVSFYLLKDCQTVADLFNKILFNSHLSIVPIGQESYKEKKFSFRFVCW